MGSAKIASEADLEGSIRWFRIDAVDGVELMDVRGVSRKWAHHHETYALCTRNGGARTPSATWLYRGRQHTMGHGGSMLMEPGEFHTNVREAPAADFGVLLVTRERLLSLLRLARGWRSGAPALRLPQVHDAGIEAAANEVFQAMHRADTNRAQDGLLILAERLLEHRVFEQAAPRSNRTNERDAARRAFELIQDRWRDDLTLAEIVGEVGVPASTLSHAFRRNFGLGLRMYRRYVRLERSRLLLCERTDPVNVIARHCGFSDQPTFWHAFKRSFGVTPAAYRCGSSRSRRE